LYVHGKSVASGRSVTLLIAVSIVSPPLSGIFKTLTGNKFLKHNDARAGCPGGDWPPRKRRRRLNMKNA
jgi:hypothetical protein